MPEISVIAQNIQDLYYQSYKSDEDFFEDYHFQYLAGVAYSKLLQDEFQRSYAQNLAEEGFGFISLSQDWLKNEEVDVKKDIYDEIYAELKHKPFSFSFDKQTSGIQTVMPMGGGCGEFIRTTIEEKWKISQLPFNKKTFWYLTGTKIFLLNLCCNPKKLRVFYVPGLGSEIDPSFEIPEVKQADIIDWVLTRMFTARQGGVVEMTNNSNPNKGMDTEIDNLFNKAKNTGR